ncbi:collagen alpha-3(IV) chain-like [Electrophorus electricus]|uniref:collagen alpha-3(IV) chain-like n=1 Tax=Electrophorus electricus TaxID=8005 RepID=UPI0015CFB53A|nr:collagen alpha-3(IV) chain-like [Electrophorus electricus]
MVYQLKAHPGDPGPPGQQGGIGGVGPDGPVGPSGLKGKKGPEGASGQAGSPGVPGPSGEKGSRGLPGLSGEQGRDGPQGQKGSVGHEGAQITNGYRDGFLFTVHSQSQENPVCPDGTLTMYSGYSLLYISVNSWGHGQDLGTLGSCLVQFSTVPFLFCDPNETCYYAASDSNSYWLSTDTPMPRDTSATTLAQYISRCSVCEASGNVIVIHSQMSTEQDCPSGWQELWSGYSFVMQTGTEAEGSGQPLASPGSCLKKFQKVPFIECHASGTCKYSFDSNSHWLAVVDRNRMFSKPVPQTLVGDSPGNIISRCKVCMKIP